MPNCGCASISLPCRSIRVSNANSCCSHRLKPPNQALHLTGAALLVSRGNRPVQAAPAGELGR